MSRRLILGLSTLSLVATPLSAQQGVTSAGPDGVSVTVYRDMSRGEGGEVNLSWLQGYALITETRTVSVPAGETQLRFEGVSGGIIPVSAIVTGLPSGVLQKNRDARVLSPAALLDGSLGNRVILKRTNIKTGAVDEQEAVLRAGPDQGVILQTRDGFEAMRCGGQNETIVYTKIPDGLSARPVLSVLTRSERPYVGKVQLSYLSRNFDWAANYVVEVAADKGTLNVFAWLTLANGNGESFVLANTQAIAGTVNRDRNAKTQEQPPRQPRVSIRCWPMDITSTHPVTEFERQELEQRRQYEYLMEARPTPEPMAIMGTMAQDGVMSARKSMQAKQEELGDLKLYRIPERVTVAANAQKQVAMIEKTSVPFERIYEVAVSPAYQITSAQPIAQLLRLMNTEKKGLGLPLPSGRAAIFEQVSGQMLLAGRAPVRDSAVGEKVELQMGNSPQVRYTLKGLNQARIFEISNANPYAVTVEVSFYDQPAEHVVDASAKLGRKNGRPMWLATVPANGTASLNYKVQRAKKK
jgi:hypothetical protein